MESWRLHLCVWRTVNMHKSSSIPLHYHYLNSSFVAVQKIEHQNKFEYFEPRTSSSKYHQLFNELDEKWCTVFSFQKISNSNLW